MSAKNQRTLFWTGVFVILFLGLGAQFGWFQKTELSDITVAKVGAFELSAKDYSKKLSLRLSQHDPLALKDPQILAFHKQAVLDDFIRISLVRNWAQTTKNFVSQSELENEVAKITSQYPDETSFKQGLLSSGLSYQEWKKKLEANLLQKKLFAYLLKKIPSPEKKELKSYYVNNKELFKINSQVRLRQVVLEKEDSAQRLYHSLKKSTDFKEIAKEFSVAPEAEKGGDTGWIERGTLEVFDKAFKMRVGQRSGVLKSPYGYHIFEVIGKKMESTLSFEQARDKILEALRTHRQQAGFSWLEDQIQNTKVLVHQEFINSLTVETLEDS